MTKEKAKHTSFLSHHPCSHADTISLKNPIREQLWEGTTVHGASDETSKKQIKIIFIHNLTIKYPSFLIRVIQSTSLLY